MRKKMKEPTFNLTANSTLQSIIDHYEWMLNSGTLKIGDAGFKRYKQLKQKRWEQWNQRRMKYGDTYAGKAPER